MNQVSIVVGGGVLSEAILHPFSQPLDFVVGSSNGLRVFTPLGCPFLCLDLTVTCSEDTVVRLVRVRPSLPEGEGLVGCKSWGFLRNRMGPGDGGWFCRWNWRRHGKSVTGRMATPDSGLMERGGGKMCTLERFLGSWTRSRFKNVF